MTIQEIKQAIVNGAIVACGDSRHLVILDSFELWGLAVFNMLSRSSVELTLALADDCFIVGEC